MICLFIFISFVNYVGNGMKNANKLTRMSFICLFFVFVPFGILVVR